MSVLEVEVDLFTLHVDARATIQAALNTGGQDADSAALQDVLAARGAVVTATLDRPDEPPVLVPRFVSTVDDLVVALSAAGVLSVATVWREPATDAYISQGRYLTALQAHTSFRVRLREMDGPVEERVVPIAAGWYLLGEVGDVVPGLVGVASVDPAAFGHAAPQIADFAERLTTWVVEAEGFGASRCDAQCTACGRTWYAEAGSWHFVSEDDRPAWFYDDAYGFAGNTIACPACATGRVGFAIS
jgi:hypothetical protein